MTIYVGSENIVSPLGETINDNFRQVKEGKSALKKTHSERIGSHDMFIGQIDIPHKNEDSKAEYLANLTLNESLKKANIKSLSEDCLLVLSTTKGHIDPLASDNIDAASLPLLLEKIQNRIPFETTGKIISCACISGLSATIYAADKIRLGKFKNAIIVGVDIISAFTYKGFESFFALDAEQCKPFDAKRNGLNLGEAAVSLILSSSEKTYSQTPAIYLGGSTANDANHISGPSRTGEGLARSIGNTLNYSKLTASDIDFISAHGTGTLYNDDMESQALSRLHLQNTPVNSFKSYFGHTLGACGLIEIGLSLQCLRQNYYIKTLGCTSPKTIKPIQIITDNYSSPLNIVLKTASGFGGCNASAIFKLV